MTSTLPPTLPQDAGKIVSVGRFADPFEAQMAKGMLEAAGIECFLEGSNMNAIYPSVIRARLQVREIDEGSACDLLAEILPVSAHGD